MIKRLLSTVITIIILLTLTSNLSAQQKATLTAASTDCSTAISCLSVIIDNVTTNAGAVTFTISANASGNTIQFEASGDGGTTWVALNVYPSTGTQTAITSSTSTGTWQANTAGYSNVRARMSTLVGTTTSVAIKLSTASASSGRGGGGSGTITNQVAKGISANTSGTASLVDSVVCTPPAVNGIYSVEYTVTASAAVLPDCNQAGLGGTAITGSTATYTVLYSDFGHVVNHDVAGSAAVTVTLPTATTLTDSTFAFRYSNHSASVDTITPTTWTIQNGASAAGASISVPPGDTCAVKVDPNSATNWIADCFQGPGATAAFWAVTQGTDSGSIAPCNVANTRCIEAPTAVTAMKEIKAGTVPVIPSYEQTNSCGSAICTDSWHPVPVLLTVTGDFTDSTTNTLTLVTGLSTTMPVSQAVVISAHCSLLFDQATAAVSDSIGIGITGTAPTSANASATSYTSASVEATGTLVSLASITPTAVVTFTPSAITTVWKATLDATIEQPSNATPGVFGVYVSTSTGADNFIVKRGSFCSVIYQ